jgi:hypothetical protein
VITLPAYPLSAVAVAGLGWAVLDGARNRSPDPALRGDRYTNLFGLMPWITQRGMGSTRRRYWSVSATMLLGACVFEWLLLRAGTYTSYGNQPLDMWGYPMIWMTINTGACLVAVVVVFRFPGFFTGTRALAAVALVPCADGRLRTGVTAPATQPSRTIEEARA